MAVKVAIQGDPGAFSEMAALEYFPNARISYKHSFHEVFESAEHGTTDCAVVPVENSIEGTVNEVYDLLLHTGKLNAIAEIYQRIHHCLIGNQGVKMQKIRTAYSHPQALAQCREYLQKRKIEPIASYDTAGAVKLIKDRKIKDAAAIASKRAAEFYKMKILDEGIEDRKHNFTRFLVLCRRKSPIRKKERNSGFKTSIIFSIPHTPGSLHAILGEFAKHGINLTKVESRPTKEKPWEYNFYLDFEGTHRDEKIIETLEHLKKITSSLKIIGSYARAKLI